MMKMGMNFNKTDLPSKKFEKWEMNFSKNHVLLISPNCNIVTFFVTYQILIKNLLTRL